MELEYLLPFLSILIIIVLSRLLSGIGKKKQKPGQDRFRLQDPEPEKRGRVRTDAYDLYFDMPSEQEVSMEAQQPKKKKKKAVRVQTVNKPVTEVSMMQAPTPGTGQKKSFPAFSENPVVNGIVWAEVLARGGTRRTVHRKNGGC